MAKSYTSEELRGAVAQASSIKESLDLLGLSASGDAYRHFRLEIDKHGIDTSHFSRKRNTDWTSKPIEYYLKENGPLIKSVGLKNKLFVAGLLERKCYGCGITEWQDQPAPLDLEHKDGNHYNNRIENLTILCANCHRQTDTWGYKRGSPNSNRSKAPVDKKWAMNKCIVCDAAIDKKSKVCLRHIEKKEKIAWPTNEELLDMLGRSNYAKVAVRLGVSDNAIRKRLKKNGYDVKNLTRTRK